MDSYRAQLYGIFCTLLTISRLINTHNIQARKIVITCNNKASLEHAFLHNQRAVTQSSYAILWTINDIRCDLPIHFIAMHVKGHQDRKQSPLTLVEKLNCYVDIKAEECKDYIEGSTTYQYSDIQCFSSWNCCIDG